VLFRNAFSAAPVCSGSRAALLTGQHCHSNGMLGLAHRGWSLHDYGTLWVHALRPAGYRSTLIGEQHLSVDPGVLGYDEVVDVPSNHASEVTPRAVEAIASLPEPWFLSVGFFETHRSFAAPTSVRDTRTRSRRPTCPTPPPCARTWPPSRRASARSTRASGPS
jgi:N-sulfoglucosamine sulfohydrolase